VGRERDDKQEREGRKEETKEVMRNETVLMYCLHQVAVICTYIHQSFLNELSLLKLFDQSVLRLMLFEVRLPHRRYRWPCGLTCSPAAARVLGAWVRTPPGAWVFSFFVSCR